MKKTYVKLNPLGFALIITFSVILFLVSCDEEYTIGHEQVEHVDFKKFKTYAWLPILDSISGQGVDAYQLKNAIFTNVEDQLFKRNLKVDTVKPDMLVRFSIMLNTNVAIVNVPIYDYRPTVSYGVGYGYGGGYGSVGVYNQQVQVGSMAQQVPYRNGQLIIEIIDHSTNKAVWRGYAYSLRQVDNKYAEVEAMRKHLQKIISDIFWYCPVKNK